MWKQLDEALKEVNCSSNVPVNGKNAEKYSKSQKQVKCKWKHTDFARPHKPFHRLIYCSLKSFLCCSTRVKISMRKPLLPTYEVPLIHTIVLLLWPTPICEVWLGAGNLTEPSWWHAVLCLQFFGIALLVVIAVQNCEWKTEGCRCYLIMHRKVCRRFWFL